MAYVQNPKAGVLHLMVGEREVILQDQALVARILNGGRAAGRQRNVLAPRSPGVYKDPAADNTDVYAFVSPDAPGHGDPDRELRPAPAPDGGPNFFEFGDDVLYEIHISTGDARPT